MVNIIFSLSLVVFVTSIQAPDADFDIGIARTLAPVACIVNSLFLFVLFSSSAY